MRITGYVQKVNSKQSDDYFKSRPVGSQLGALASPQSQVIENREWLDAKFESLSKEMHGEFVKRPLH